MTLGLSAPPAVRVSECARYMGVSSNWICKAITEGMPVHGVTVKLEAEVVPGGPRHTYRIYEDQFKAFLVAIHWKRIPAGPTPPESSREP
jgi:hypothetical protein